MVSNVAKPSAHNRWLGGYVGVMVNGRPSIQNKRRPTGQTYKLMKNKNYAGRFAGRQQRHWGLDAGKFSNLGLLIGRDGLFTGFSV
ncbi:MAG: hypothetical protein H7836_14940 [Magnetococcus sp. YQC-3]